MHKTKTGDEKPALKKYMCSWIDSYGINSYGFKFINKFTWIRICSSGKGKKLSMASRKWLKSSPSLLRRRSRAEDSNCLCPRGKTTNPLSVHFLKVRDIFLISTTICFLKGKWWPKSTPSIFTEQNALDPPYSKCSWGCCRQNELQWEKSFMPPAGHYCTGKKNQHKEMLWKSTSSISFLSK